MTHLIQIYHEYIHFVTPIEYVTVQNQTSIHCHNTITIVQAVI